MKTLVLVTALLLGSLSAQAKNIAATKQSVTPASIDKLIVLADQKEPGSSHKKISLVVTDHGMSTDVSPRYTVYLGLASMAEMGNITADFRINKNVYEFISATVKSAGVYEIKVLEYRDEGMFEVTQTIDAKKMLTDEQALRNRCGSDFCDSTLKTSVSVSETATKQ